MNDFTDEEKDFELAGLFDMDTAGLLVVDVQEKLWPFIYNKEAVLTKMIQAIKVAGHLGLPIIVTEQYVKGLGSTIEPVKKTLDEFGAYNPTEKFDFSCFGEEKFVERLAGTGIESLGIIGIESHICVMQTTIEGLDRGLDMFYLSEATGSRDPEHKKEAILRVRDEGAITGSVEMYAFEAMRTSKHPAFKAVQKVII